MPRKAQSYQPSLPYLEGKQAQCNAIYLDHGQEPHQLRNMYSPQGVRSPQGVGYPQVAESLSFNPSRSRNPYVNSSIQYVYQWGNPLCFKCGVLGYTSPEYHSDILLPRAESTYLSDFYQRPAPNHKPDFFITRQIQNNQNFLRDQYHSNNNPVTTQSILVAAKTIKPVQS